jgi:putative transcriptional regulator
MSCQKTVKRIRMNLCLEQGEFAELLGITKGAICHYENGLRMPRLPIIRKMRQIAKENNLHIPLEDFFN